MNDKNIEVSFISLKWGTLKEWDLKSEKEIELFKKYSSLGMSWGAAQQKDTLEQKKILCELVNECNNPKGIYLDWEGKFVSKAKARKYIMEY